MRNITKFHFKCCGNWLQQQNQQNFASWLKFAWVNKGESTSLLKAKIAHLYELHVIVHIFSPEIFILVQSNVKPWFHFPIVVDDSGIVDLIHTDARIVSKPKNMPRFV